MYNDIFTLIQICVPMKQGGGTPTPYPRESLVPVPLPPLAVQPRTPAYPPPRICRCKHTSQNRLAFFSIFILKSFLLCRYNIYIYTYI
ncbi:unnamed protein product, partial [Ixodes hexagonus]